MYIESLEIINFKNLRHLQLDNIPKLVVLAGPNGSGKTSVFDALRIFKEAIAGYSVRYPGTSQISTILQQVGPVVTIGEAEAKITASIKVVGVERTALGLPENHTGKLKSSVIIRPPTMPDQVESVSVTGDTDYLYLRRLLGESYTSGGTLGVIDHIGSYRQFADSAVTSIDFSLEIQERELQSLVVNAAGKFANLSQQLVLMHLLDIVEQHNQTENPHFYINGVREIFHHFLPDTELLDIDIPTDFSHAPGVLVRNGGVTHSINQLSSGQKEILMTYTHLEKLRPAGSIILFDEPELHLHPTLQRRVIEHLHRVLERGNNQIWVVTHSEEIVDTTEYESLFAMNGVGNPTVVAVKERTDRIDLLQHLGANVGLQLTSPRILFLEGESDAELLPLFFETLPTGVSLVETTGKDTLMRLTPAAMKLLEEVVTSGQFYLVRDRDVEDDPDSIDALAKKYTGHFFTWDRYHIENYLLDEIAIYHVLAEDPDVHIDCSPSGVDQQLRSLADERMDNVLAKYLEARLNMPLKKRLRLNVPQGVKISLQKATEARLLQLNDSLNTKSVEQLYVDVQTKLDQRWDTEWRAMCIGRDVLQAYHQRYVKQYYSYGVFRNRVARKIRELKRVPKALSELMESVTLDLPRGDDKDVSVP